MVDTRDAARQLVGIVAIAIAVLVRATSLPAQTVIPAPQAVGSIQGQIADESGAALAGATITIVSDDGTIEAEAVSRDDGRFAVAHVSAGRFQLTVSAPGFAPSTLSGRLSPDETLKLPLIRLTLSGGAVSIDVTPSREEIAEKQIAQQEQQRLLGVFPNFLVSYDPNAAPLNPRQKFQLTWKSIVDPVQFVSVAAVAGIQQARDDFSGFGGGVEGYAKRYAALYATHLTGTVISRFVMPVVFRQDPRYFYKGTGTRSSRAGYAISRAVIRKTDTGGWQPDYSRILGHLAAGAISNLYYPPEDRRGVGLTLGNAALGIGGAAVSNLMQEFVFRRLTTHSR